MDEPDGKNEDGESVGGTIANALLSAAAAASSDDDDDPLDEDSPPGPTTAGQFLIYLFVIAFLALLAWIFGC